MNPELTKPRVPLRVDFDGIAEGADWFPRIGFGTHVHEDCGQRDDGGDGGYFQGTSVFRVGERGKTVAEEWRPADR